MTAQRSGRRAAWPLLLLAACLGVFVSLDAAGFDAGELRLFKYLMGTSVRVEIFGGDPSLRQQAADEAFAAVAEVDRLMSEYRADSELSRLNRRATGDEAAVSAATATVIAAGARLAMQTRGAFGITTPPGAESSITVNRYRQTIRITVPGVTVTARGLAKGFAAELASKSLARRGLAGTIDTGGTQMMVGLPPGKRAWSVGIADPFHPGAVLGAIDLQGGAVSTTSAATHLVDPRTSRPATAALSVTIVSPDGTMSEALSRAVFVLGERDGLPLLRQFDGTWGVVASRAADGRTLVRVSDGRERSFHPAPRT